MLLSLTQIFSSRASLLLFLVSCLLSWKNVVSTSTCAEKDATIQDSLEKLLTLTTYMSHVVSSETAKLFTEFNNQYAQGKRYNDRIPGTCHTALFDTPVNKEQSLGRNAETLLTMVHSLLNSWTNALNHLVNEMSAMQGDPSPLISKAREIQAKFDELTTGVKTILSMIGKSDSETYLAWSGLASLQSSNEDVRCFSFYTLIRCLLRDSRKDIYHEGIVMHVKGLQTLIEIIMWFVSLGYYLLSILIDLGFVSGLYIVTWKYLYHDQKSSYHMLNSTYMYCTRNM